MFGGASLMIKDVVGVELVFRGVFQIAESLTEAIVRKIQFFQGVNERVASGEADCDEVCVKLHLPGERAPHKIDAIKSAFQNFAKDPQNGKNDIPTPCGRL